MTHSTLLTLLLTTPFAAAVLPLAERLLLTSNRSHASSKTSGAQPKSRPPPHATWNSASRELLLPRRPRPH